MTATAAEAHAFTLRARGPFSLEASARFIEGFSPTAAAVSRRGDHLHLAFVTDEGRASAGVCLRPAPDGATAEVYGLPAGSGAAAQTSRILAVAAQVSRILHLHVDGRDFLEIGARDPVVGRLQKARPGLRPVSFFSPYEAAAWALISHRIRIAQAARVRERLAAELGASVDIHGDARSAFPEPSRLRELSAFPGLSERKVESLRALAEAAGSGLLDAARLRSSSSERALAELRALPGIGEFSAELILVRGAGAPDVLPLAERRLAKAVAHAYALEHEPSPDELEHLAEAWRPHRSWVSFLLRVALEAGD